MAASHPESVMRLAVVDVTIPGDGRPDISQGGRRWHHGRHRPPELAEQLVGDREDIYLGWFYRNYGHRPDVIAPEAVAEYLRTYRDPDALRAGFEYYRALPADIADNQGGRTARLAMPVLAVGGSEGWGRGTEVAASLRQMAIDVQEVIVAPSGRWVPEEQPEILARHLLSFLASGPLQNRPPHRVSQA